MRDTTIDLLFTILLIDSMINYKLKKFLIKIYIYLFITIYGAFRDILKI